MTTTQITVAASKDFLEAANNLPSNSRSKVLSFILKFYNNPCSPGLNYERIEGVKDPRIRSLRVDQSVRCIVLSPEKGNAYVLLWVDKHDDAYRWARRKVCHVNRVSGALQLVDVEAAEMAVREASISMFASPTRRESSLSLEIPNSLFAGSSDDQLMLLGVPEVLIPAVRAVSDEDDFVRLIEWMPSTCVDGLILLIQGKSINEVINELEHERPSVLVDPEDVATALETMESQADFIVITDDQVLEAMLSAPLEQWRVFLHPSQRKLIERDWKGPVRVLGGAGTGKTVVAMHRVRWLAKRLVEEGAPGRILFTTFNRNLAIDIHSSLIKICSTEELQRIEVVNLDRWVMSYLKSQGVQMDVFNRKSKKAAWKSVEHLYDPEVSSERRFYEEEWKDVILASDCRSRDDYFKARRVGRGTRLSRKKRNQIWPVFDALRAEFRHRGLGEPEEAKQAAADLLRQSGRPALFKAVVVDEAQDLDAASFRLIRVLAGNAHDNDIFIVGDPHQRIYGKPVVLGRCGIEIRGRSRKLRINYRTTEETRAWATAVLHDLNFDDLDGGSDPARDYFSLLHGDKPLIRTFEKPEEENTFMFEILRQIRKEQGTLASTCITARTEEKVNYFKSMLDCEGIENHVIKAYESDDPSDVSLRLATMHRVKGLEFDQVLIPGLNADQMPLKAVLDLRPDQVSRELFEQQERSLLHVAATRAKKRVIITYTGEGSTFVTELKL